MIRSLSIAAAFVGLVGVGFFGSADYAFAEDIFVNDGQRVSLSISHQFPTRLSFKNDVGKQFIFNKIDGESPDVSTTVGQSGDVFISVTNGAVGDVLGGFITTSQGYTYPVDILISDKKQDHIVVYNSSLESKIKQAKVNKADTSSVSSTKAASVKPAVNWNSDTGHYQSVALLMRALYHRRGYEGFTQSNFVNSVSLSSSIVESVSYSLISGNRVGVVSVLRNTSDEAFYLPDLIKERQDIVAIAFSDELLDVGETVTSYSILRRGGF